MTKRKVCVVTGSRAEYGLLYWLMREIQGDPQLELQVAVTGMHLGPEFGHTIDRIEADGFSIHAKVEMLLSGDSPVAITKSVGLGVIGFADAFDRLRPDLVVVLGDRFEILAVAEAALLAKIPIAHLHGGEATYGAVDEAIRHAITKMSQLHFVAAEAYRKRVIQLGEDPKHVFNFGAPGLDAAVRLKLLGRAELEKELEFKLADTNFLVTYHPETLTEADSREGLRALFGALDEFVAARIVITKSNADAGGKALNRLIDEYARQNPERVRVADALGQKLYFSAITHSSVVVGNSSSGLIEVPYFKKPTVNIGDRQKGRLKSESVIDCGCSRAEIVAAIQQALSDDFQSRVRVAESLYGQGDTAFKVKEVLKSVPLKNIMVKTFHDL